MSGPATPGDPRSGEGRRVRVWLPAHLRELGGVEKEVLVTVAGPVTTRALLDALEASHPPLRGTIRDHATGARRAYMRYFACGQDLSHASPDAPLPEAVAEGRKVFRVVGAIAGG